MLESHPGVMTHCFDLCYSLWYLQFLDTGHELGNHYNEVIAPQDIATYGGLCALASFDRTELKACTLSFYFSAILFWFSLFFSHQVLLFDRIKL